MDDDHDLKDEQVEAEAEAPVVDEQAAADEAPALDEVDLPPLADIEEREDVIDDPLISINERLERVDASTATVGDGLGGVKSTLDDLAKRISFIPSQVRNLSAKVEDLGTTIGESKYRRLLMDLLMFFDMVDQMLRSMGDAPADESEATHRRNYEVLGSQLRQMLEVNGLFEVPTDGAFDPNVHRAMEMIACDDTADHDRVLKVIRRGFKTEHAVLRYAEVAVGQCRPNGDDETDDVKEA